MTGQSTDRTPVSYVRRTRDYYQSRGFERPYVWAQHDGSPFSQLGRPLSELTVGVVTTASIHLNQSDVLLADSPKLFPYAQDVGPPPPRMFTNHLSWHKTATNTNDVETFLPLGALAREAQNARVKAPSPRFYGVPSNYSQRGTVTEAEVIHEWCVQDDVDVVVLVPL